MRQPVSTHARFPARVASLAESPRVRSLIIYAVRNMPYEYEYRYRQFRTLRTVRVPYPRPMLLPGGGKPPPPGPPPLNPKTPLLYSYEHALAIDTPAIKYSTVSGHIGSRTRSVPY